MSLETLLVKTRKLNWLLQHSGSEIILFNEICKILSDLLNSSVLIISNKAKLLGEITKDINYFVDTKTGNYINSNINEQLNSITETKENLKGSDFYGLSKDFDLYNVSLIPINGDSNRQGTLLMYKTDGIYSMEDIILGEYGSTIIGLELLHYENEKNTERYRKNSIVKSAISTLSYSELEAIIHIFNELNGSEGLVIASKVADKVGITRSVIVNALRKFESAGVIESRSLGMKGTYIKILNDVLTCELKKLKNN